MAKPTVNLIPWDPESPEHVNRMTEQRIACGWDAPLVATEWKDEHINGKKCIYWIVFPKDELRREKYLKMHTEAYPKETEELVDSNKILSSKSRIPTNSGFIPIGHITLGNNIPSYAEKIDLRFTQSGSYWIKSLYVSYVLQGLGVGGSAMDITERMATEEPLKARHLLLDTVHQDDQSDKDFALAIYGGALKISTQAWYERRGYRCIGTVENLYENFDSTGKVWRCRTVFLQKDIA